MAERLNDGDFHTLGKDYCALVDPTRVGKGFKMASNISVATHFIRLIWKIIFIIIFQALDRQWRHMWHLPNCFWRLLPWMQDSWGRLPGSLGCLYSLLPYTLHHEMDWSSESKLYYWHWTKTFPKVTNTFPWSNCFHRTQTVYNIYL